MSKEISHNIRLGFFVTSALVLLILALYFIGNNKNIFGSTFKLYTTFQNINGLQNGNNIRYAGINVGTVKKISIKNDTAVYVEMIIEENMKSFIHKNSITSIGTDGLMGNKLINIDAGTADSPLVNEGDEIFSRPQINTDDMLRTLDITNQNVALVSADLKDITGNLSKSRGTLYKVLLDTTLAESLQKTFSSIQKVSTDLSSVSGELNALVLGVKKGEGTVGLLLKDTALSNSIQESINNINVSAKNVAELSDNLNKTILQIKEGNGTVGTLVSDTAVANSLKRTMINIEQGTAKFDEDMKALQHNFLTKGYFKEEEKKKAKAEKQKK